MISRHAKPTKSEIWVLKNQPFLFSVAVKNGIKQNIKLNTNFKSVSSCLSEAAINSRRDASGCQEICSILKYSSLRLPFSESLKRMLVLF